MLHNIFHKASILQALHYNHLKTFKFHNVKSYLTNFSIKHLQIKYHSPGSLPGLKVHLKSEENISLNALNVAPPESYSGPNVHLLNSKWNLHFSGKIPQLKNFIKNKYNALNMAPTESDSGPMFIQWTASNTHRCTETITETYK